MRHTYVVYARKSQEDQGRQVQSIESQTQEARQLTARELLYVKEVVTESRSAKEPGNRPEFDRMVRMIERGEADGIVAWHPDRLSRNETDAASITRLLRQGKLRDLRFVSYHFINSPEGIMMLQIALSQSQYQNSKLAVDVRRGLQNKRSQGWFPHRAPEGYLNDLRQHTIVVDPERFPLIRKGWDMLLSGHYSVPQVVAALNKMGYRTLQRRSSGGGPLAMTSGYQIFRNPFYSGKFRDRGGESPGAHEPMVSEEEFARVQALIGKRSYVHSTKHSHPYSTAIRCRRCGWRATTELSHGAHRSGAYVYIHCANRRCCGRSVRQDRFEKQILNLMKAIHVDAEFHQLAISELDAWMTKNHQQRALADQSGSSALEEIERASDRLLDLLARGIIMEEEFAQKRRAFTEEARVIRGELLAANRGATTKAHFVTAALEFARWAPDLFQGADKRLRRQMLDCISTACWINGTEIEIELHPLFECIRRRKKPPTEPSKNGSSSTKKEHVRAHIFFGRPEEFISELLSIASTSEPLRYVDTWQHPEFPSGGGDRMAA